MEKKTFLTSCELLNHSCTFLLYEIIHSFLFFFLRKPRVGLLSLANKSPKSIYVLVHAMNQVDTVQDL